MKANIKLQAHRVITLMLTPGMVYLTSFSLGAEPPAKEPRIGWLSGRNPAAHAQFSKIFLNGAPSADKVIE